MHFLTFCVNIAAGIYALVKFSLVVQNAHGAYLEHDDIRVSDVVVVLALVQG